MVYADTQHVPAENQQSFSERVLHVALRIGIAVGAIALFSANLLPDGLQSYGFDGDIVDPLLGDVSGE